MPDEHTTAQDDARPPDFRVEIEEKLSELLKPSTATGFERLLLSVLTKAFAAAFALFFKLGGEVLATAGQAVIDGKEQADPTFRRLTAVAIRGIFGAGINPDDFGAPLSSGPDPTAERRLGAAIISSLIAASQTGGEVNEPSSAGAEQYIGAVSKMAMQGWLQSVLFEAVPFLGQVEAAGQLDEGLMRVLGFENVTNAVLQPYLDALAVQPLEWKVSKQYRHRLLRNLDAIDAYVKGQWTWEKTREELARQGLSDERIDVMIGQAWKRGTFEDLVYEHFRGAISDLEVIQRARDLGYDASEAYRQLEIRKAKRRDRWLDPIVDACVTAFVARDIDEAELRRVVEANAPSHEEAQFIITSAKFKRNLRIRSLSSGEARRLALKKILSASDYRRALQREGYEPEAVVALELELRIELDEQADAAEARRKLEEERRLEREAKERERQEREAELAARRALPSLPEYRRAYVRGHISRDGLQAAIARDKGAISPADLALLLADADADRADYLERLDERARIAARRHDQTLPIAAFEDAVMRGVFTLEEFDARLAERKLPDDERRLLVDLLADRLADRDESEQRRREAEARAQQRQVSLPDFERAVRLGLRTRDELRALLASVDTPDVQIALVLDLLDRQIADDTAARERRAQEEAAEAERRRRIEEERDARERDRLIREAQRAIPVALRRRAVINGLRDRGYYEQSLIDAGWKVEDQLTELALVDLEIAQAEADRERRRQIAEEAERRRLEREEAERRREAELALRRTQAAVPVANYRRGVLAGLVTPAQYEDAIVRAGWTPEQIAAELALVAHELDELAAAEERRLQIEADLAARRERQRLREEERDRIRNLPPPPPELTLAQMERAVVLGLAVPDELRAWLLDRAYDPEDVELIVALALARIPDVRNGEEVEARVERELAAQRIQLGDLKRAVKRGLRTLDDYAADLASRGIGAGDVELLGILLAEELALDLACSPALWAW